jgi:hypothetical protein
MKSELLSVLRKLKPVENKKLKCFLENPYFSHNKNLNLLFDCLLDFYPLYDISKSDKIKIFKRIYGDIEYNDSTLRSLTHLLLTSVEDFVVTEYSIKNKVTRNVNLLKFLYERNINDFFEKSVESLETLVAEQLSIFSSESLLAFNEIEVLKYNFQKSNEKILHKDSTYSQSDILLKSNQYLVLHFFIEIVSDYVIREIRQKKYSAEQANLFRPETLINFETLESLIGQSDLKEVYNAYLLLYKMFSYFNDESYYFEYKKRVLKNLPKINKEEAAFHFSSMVSYCLMRKNSENDELFSKELWELYEIILEHGLYSNSTNRNLDIWLYRAILFLGLKLRYFDKVKKIIDNYSIKVKPSEIKNIINLSYAYYYYERGNFDLALEHAKYIKLSNFILKYDIKNLLIKIYFEQNYLENLDSIIHSYREFLKNDNILNSDLKNQFQNFLAHVEKLVTCSFDKDDLELKYQMDELSKNNYVYAKEWLLEKYSNALSLPANA